MLHNNIDRLWDYIIDHQRIVSCQSFKRLQHKTQVMCNDPQFKNDNFRNRLTHSIEVVSIGKIIAYKIGIATDQKIRLELVENIALAHDIGHPPFGHAGERVLNSLMRHHGGFCHNHQALKILTCIESYTSAKFTQGDHRFDGGLKLTLDLLEGVAKHNGPKLDDTNLYAIEKEMQQKYAVDLTAAACLEAQIASLADDIAYVSHDVLDGIKLGFISQKEISKIPSLSNMLRHANNHSIQLLEDDIHPQILSQSIRDILTNDVIDTSITNINSLLQQNISQAISQEVEQFDTIQFSKPGRSMLQDLKGFLLKNFYKHPYINSQSIKAEEVISKLFSMYTKHPNCLPLKWQAKLEKESIEIVVCDYIACMTDRFALHLARA